MRRVSASAIGGLLAKHLEVEPRRVVPTARLVEDLDASPLALVQLALALEEHFDIEICESDVAAFVTVEDVMACIARVDDSRTREDDDG